MNFEIISFYLVFFASFIFAAANKGSSLVFRLVLTALSAFYVISIRFAEFDADINVYAREFYSDSYSLYYTREAIFWLGSRLVFSISESEIVTFILLDLLVVSVLFFSLREFSAPKYSFFLILILFPIVFGFQNIYRQLFATAFLLLGVGLLYSGRRRWAGVGLVSVLAHNPSALFVPLSLRFVRYKIWVGFFVGVILGASLGFLSQFESSSTSGGNFSYVLSSAVLVFVGLLVGKTALWQRPFRGFFIGLAAISVLSPLLLASSTSERISFYAISMLFPFLVLWSENFVRPKFPVRGFIILFFVTPTFLSSARGFILY